MPPTTGHLRLLRFATLVADQVRVIVWTQPHEPFVRERVGALRVAVDRCGLTNIELVHVDREIEQDPSAPGYWQMWRALMTGFGLGPDDCVVASEPYGKTLADLVGATFVPYDIDRVLDPAKATAVRADPLGHFSWVLPEFRPHLRTTVTVFGAESTGKTTLAPALAHALDGTWIFEYARPYLETSGHAVDVASMTAIGHGQAALQRLAADDGETCPVIVQDTDLFSTVGYWQFPHWRPVLGECPAGLVAEALELRSDLYLVTPATIAFEPDPLRFAGDRREGSDEYWVGVLERYGLPYVVLEATDRRERLAESVEAVRRLSGERAGRLWFDREGR